MDDYELYHYGVKVMKWGVIRWKDKLGYGRLHKLGESYTRRGRSTVSSVDSHGGASGLKGFESW